jgi:hypothetical protein
VPTSPEPTWEDLKVQGRVRYFQIANAEYRKAWGLKWLLYGSLVRACKDPREVEDKLRPFFPDAWSKPSRWYYDRLLMQKRAQALDWMHGRPLQRIPQCFVNLVLLSWSNPNKEYR